MQLLKDRGCVEHKKLKGSTNLFLGGAQGGNIDWKRLGSMSRGLKPITNYFRGHKWVSRKVSMAKLMRSYCEKQGPDAPAIMPRYATTSACL